MVAKNGGKRSGRSKLGRQKIEIKRITSEEARQVCFSKRRHGLIKKAGELGILCGAEVAIIAFSPAGKAFSYGDPTVDSVINRFRDPSSHVPARSNEHLEPTFQELHTQHEKLVQQIEVETKRNQELQKHQQSEEGGHAGLIWDADVDSLTPEQLEEVERALDDMRSALANRANELIMGMAMVHLPPTGHQNHHQFHPPPSLAPPYASASSIPPTPSNSFLNGYNHNSMPIPFIHGIKASPAASGHVEAMPNSRDYFFGNHFAGRPFHRL
ncbi:unnamed protein product [Victoria cruziana]